MSGRTVKVVIIGSAGVGKTSLRQQYITSRFATGYRATIGTDFITKTITTPQSNEPLTLQIWDTAGQERFSALSSAFFRGADAVVLVFDVNKRETLHDLAKWWDGFRVKVPIPQGEEAGFCVVAVGNKMDLVRDGDDIVNRRMAEAFLGSLIPSEVVEDVPRSNSPDPVTTEGSQERNVPPRIPIIGRARSLSTQFFANQKEEGRTTEHALSRTNARITSPASRFGTMTSTKTGMTVYHTPSSSLFDQRTREPSADARRRSNLQQESKEDQDLDSLHDLDPSSSSLSGYDTARSKASYARIGSLASESSLSTVKPHPGSLAISFSRGQDERSTFLSPASPPRSRASTLSSSSLKYNIPNDLLTPSASPPSPPVLTASLMATLHSQAESRPLDTGPKLFFTSAKTDGGLSVTPITQVFAYLGERVVRKWEKEELEAEVANADAQPLPDQLDTRRSGFRLGSGFRLDEGMKKVKSWGASCC